MDKHPQRYILPFVRPTGFDNPRRFILDVFENRYMDLPEVAETLDTVGSADSQEI